MEYSPGFIASILLHGGALLGGCLPDPPVFGALGGLLDIGHERHLHPFNQEGGTGDDHPISRLQSFGHSDLAAKLLSSLLPNESDRY